MPTNAKIFLSVIVLLVLGVLMTVILGVESGEMSTSSPGEYDEFATCLADEGAVFYGAFWCPHCQDQKELFGSSEKLLPYEECSTLDGRSQTQVCREKGITTYPTWEFTDGSRLTGAIPLAQLAEKTSCPLPGDNTEADSTNEENN